MTRGETAKLVAMILANWTAHAARIEGASVGGMVDSYHQVLADIPNEIVGAALLRLRATAKFIPTPAEIREVCATMALGESRLPLEAWKDVRAAIGRWGRNRTPGTDFYFADPLVARAVDALGWTELCESENPTADRARFVEVYKDLVEEERVDAVTSTLPGAAAPKRLGGTTTLAEEVNRLMRPKQVALLEEPAKEKKKR